MGCREGNWYPFAVVAALRISLFAMDHIKATSSMKLLLLICPLRNHFDNSASAEAINKASLDYFTITHLSLTVVSKTTVVVSPSRFAFFLKNPFSKKLC